MFKEPRRGVVNLAFVSSSSYYVFRRFKEFEARIVCKVSRIKMYEIVSARLINLFFKMCLALPRIFLFFFDFFCFLITCSMKSGAHF